MCHMLRGIKNKWPPRPPTPNYFIPMLQLSIIQPQNNYTHRPASETWYETYLKNLSAFLPYGSMLFCVQDRHGTGFLKTQNILRVYIKTPPLTAAQTACDSTERFHSPRYSAASAVGPLIVLMIYFKADAQRRIKYIEQQNPQKFTRRDPGWAQTWLTKCK